ncbi:pumilio homolog 24-like [Actinidia eriantha]|uniref:pumilio homolog 24-like n=1 Tax=Actinidia eriantha TaxID=165200 RepID=UPI00258E3C16|nr:pumilio homolog 24-like [Actinidia eriantha]
MLNFRRSLYHLFGLTPSIFCSDNISFCCTGTLGKAFGINDTNRGARLILSIVDDTKLVAKAVIRKLQTILKELVLDKNGRRLLLQLLLLNCPRYFSPDDLAALNLSIPSLCHKGDGEENADLDKQKESSDVGEDGEHNSDTENVVTENLNSVEGGKKDPFLQRQELLVNSGLAECLIDTCIESAGELLASNFGKEVLYEVAIGGADGILHPTLDAKLDALHETIASLVAQPKSEGAEEEHLLENFHSSGTI